MSADEAWLLSTSIHAVVVVLALVLMAWGAMIDIERGQRIPGKALFLFACVLFVLNIYSAGFI